MKKLARLLKISRHEAVGLMTDLWEWTGEYASAGDIGSHDNHDIADGTGWEGDPDELIDALIEARWVDECAEHRLVIHDWSEHCESWVRKRLSRANKDFASVSPTSGQRSDIVETAASLSPKTRGLDGIGRDGIGRDGGCRGEGGQPDPDPPSKPRRSRSVHGNNVCTKSQAEEIYEHYPRKVGRAGAIKAIAKAARSLLDDDRHEEPLAFLMDRVTAYARSPAGQPPPTGCNDYRPYPATWFNNARYDDDPAEWEKPNGIDRPNKRTDTNISRVAAKPGKYAHLGKSA